MDWNSVFASTNSPLKSLIAATSLAVSGRVSLNLGGYVLASGSLSFTKSTVTGATIASGVTANLDLLMFEITGLQLFLGLGATFNADGTINSGSATGFLANTASLAVALATVSNRATGDTRRWIGVTASAASMSVVGLPSEYTMSVTNASLMYNGASGSRSSTGGVAAASLAWSSVTGASALSGVSGNLALAVSGSVSLILNQFATVSGTFGFQKSAGGELELLATDATARLESGTAIQVGVTAASRVSKASRVIPSITGLPAGQWLLNKVLAQKVLAMALYGAEATPLPERTLQQLKGGFPGCGEGPV
jgi:hypothetical protein